MTDERKPKLRKAKFQTDAEIEIKGAYGPDDARGDTTPAGTYPFTRGVQPTMYRGQFWTMRQYAGFGTARQTNERFRLLLDRASPIVGPRKGARHHPDSNRSRPRGRFARTFLRVSISRRTVRDA